MEIKQQIKEKANLIEEQISPFLPQEEGYQKTVLEAMNYSILAGGKRLRPMLMQECATLLGAVPETLAPMMAAIEMIHTYSLVHDDLPAMDNDEYRRGRKTTHVVYGEGMAILAGDGLLNYAFETAGKAFDLAENETQLRQCVKALQILARKAGVYGMIGGQCADLEAEQMPQDQVTEERLLFIHENKTAALIQAAMTIGAVLAGADDAQVAELEKAGYEIGIAFQIQDDILDVTGSIENLGKPIGSDARNEKTTYVTVHGLEMSATQVQKLSESAIGRLQCFPKRNEFLENLIRQLIYRQS